MKWTKLKKLIFSLILIFITTISYIIITPKTEIKLKLAWKESLNDLGYTNQEIERLVYYYTTDVLDVIRKQQIPSYFTRACLKYKNCQGLSLGLYYQASKGNTLELLYTINTVNRPNLLKAKGIKEKALLKDSFLVLVNKNCYLEATDTPSSLSEITVIPHIIRPNETMMMNAYAYQHYLKLYEKAKKLGLSLVIYSTYRTYEKQKTIYESLDPPDDDYVARPGHSEHQTGLALDVATIDTGLTLNFEMTPEFTFLKNFAHQEGFILRYPQRKEQITGYFYEPWHFRFVGISAATTIFQEGLTLEEYLAHYVELPYN